MVRGAKERRKENTSTKKLNSKYPTAREWEEGAVNQRCHQENSFSFFSSVLIKNLIEINQAIKSGHCTVGREKGERVSSKSEKNPSPLIQILTMTPNGTEGGTERDFL